MNEDILQSHSLRNVFIFKCAKNAQLLQPDCVITTSSSIQWYCSSVGRVQAESTILAVSPWRQDWNVFYELTHPRSKAIGPGTHFIISFGSGEFYLWGLYFPRSLWAQETNNWCVMKVTGMHPRWLVTCSIRHPLRIKRSSKEIPNSKDNK